MAPLRKLYKGKKITGILAKHVLINTTLAARDNKLPFQPAVFLRNLSTKGSISCLLRLSK
jgi:hypothetical protein